jgi:antitoxin component YwqK of YwqJK toxin-antitoxin module
LVLKDCHQKKKYFTQNKKLKRLSSPAKMSKSLPTHSVENYAAYYDISSKVEQVEDYYDNGNIAYCFQCDGYGLRHGVFEEFYMDGQLASTSIWHHGIVETKKSFERDGRIKCPNSLNLS